MIEHKHKHDHDPAAPSSSESEPPASRHAPASHFGAGRVACPRCTAHNDARAAFCAVCGELLPAGLPRLRELEPGAKRGSTERAS